MRKVDAWQTLATKATMRMQPHPETDAETPRWSEESRRYGEHSSVRMFARMFYHVPPKSATAYPDTIIQASTRGTLAAKLKILVQCKRQSEMVQWIPLFQSLVWPAVLLAFVIWRRREIDELLIEIKTRIREGAAVEFPGGKLGEKPKPIDQDNSLDKLMRVTKYALEAELKSVLPTEKLMRAITEVEKEIRREAFLTVDATPLLGPAVEPWTVPYNRFRTVSDLLNDIWATLNQRGYNLPSLSFGSAWVLEAEGRRLTDQEVGIRWARRHQERFDARPLNSPEVDIKPGMRLRVVPAANTPEHDQRGM